ncbi:Mediator of RNA polymerase II transcription subunit 21 [Ceratocystis fimbriata CBS 114723]|uniref:Mediator of RNA polymerase II transcription subunit 21 n=1 Tax=Ceratocystis fimbriata CBS 114723 TaxID=1035309 RepID=A0A2C5X2W9_9PEZI|nr:Mediator of RNA polymerase II transcription subunit 21 [Ceratocystis fimbriata CBS 114723]
MSDNLTQLQDAVDQLAQQFVACIHFVNKRHDLELLDETDQVRDGKNEVEEKEVDPLPAEDFRAGLVELARDLILTEQQIEVLISSLPGLSSTEKDQEVNIRELEEELRAAEAQRQQAIKEKDAVLANLDRVIMNIRRP